MYHFGFIVEGVTEHSSLGVKVHCYFKSIAPSAEILVPLHWHWKTQFLSTENFSYVEVEEIKVEDGLHNSRHDSYLVIEILSVETPNPVGQIEQAIEPQEKEIVRSDRFCFPCLAYHKKLRQNGHRFQIDGKSPEDLQRCKFIVF